MSSRPRALQGDEAQLFQRHNQDLLRTVARAVYGSHALAEDACSFAWIQLMRCQPERGPTLFPWLRTVAIREGYRLSRAEKRDSHMEDLGSPEQACDMLDHVRDMEDTLEALRALETLAELPDPRRRYLSLLIGGYSYDEIAQLAGERTTNHVNKHLVRARRDLRRLNAT
ncbi:MAG: hypothetical protein QOJ97_227 [Solirubrobacteraceae bacterium]|jgi:RNA polymerase sigma factor (sigma-70 family)|nr:hypothetical protein [Solirubrobacteraceae bacterium]